MGVTTATLDGVVTSARRLLRDFPIFFETDLGPVQTSTIRLPHPNVDGGSCQIYLSPNPGDDAAPSDQVTLTPVSSTMWVIDERNGLLKFSDISVLGKRCFIAGYHYEWFLDEDLSYYAGAVVGEHLHGRSDCLDIAGMQSVELDVIAMGSLVRALWSLVTQFSTEINVNTPEGMNIPANQRFQQVWQLLQQWEGEYARRAAALNVGLAAMSVYELRRKSLQTGRLVPVYVPREIDDPRPPRRLYPAISVSETIAEPACAIASHAHSIDVGLTGWRTIATSGGGGYSDGSSGELYP